MYNTSNIILVVVFIAIAITTLLIVLKYTRVNACNYSSQWDNVDDHLEACYLLASAKADYCKHRVVVLDAVNAKLLTALIEHIPSGERYKQRSVFITNTQLMISLMDSLNDVPDIKEGFVIAVDEFNKRKCRSDSINDFVLKYVQLVNDIYI